MFILQCITYLTGLKVDDAQLKGPLCNLLFAVYCELRRYSVTTETGRSETVVQRSWSGAAQVSAAECCTLYIVHVHSTVVQLYSCTVVERNWGVAAQVSATDC